MYYTETDVQEAIARIRRGRAYTESLRQKICTDASDYMIFMFSEDEEINKYTLYYLPLLMKQERIYEFLIVSPYDDAERMINDVCICRHRYIKCSIEDMKDVCRYYSTYREYWQTYSNMEKVVINGSAYPEDDKILRIIGCNGITKKEYVALAVYRYVIPPEDAEVTKVSEEIRYQEYKLIDWRKNGCLYSDYPPMFPNVISDAMDRLLESRKITKADKLILFSYTKSSRYLADKLEGYDIIAIIDNDKALSGMEYNGIPICHPKDFLRGEHHAEYRIIVPTRSYKFICEQLEYMGYGLEEQVFIVYTDYIKPKKTEEKYSIEEAVLTIEEGREIYDEIRKKHNNKMIYLIPYPGTGDMYLVGMYIKDRLMRDGVDSGILVVASKACRRVYSLMQNDASIVDVIVLEGIKETFKLQQFAKHIGYGKTGVVMLNDAFDLIDLGKMRGYRGLDFGTVFRRVVFFTDIKRNRVDIRQENSDVLFEANGLRKGRTVLFAPYTRSPRVMPDGFWEQMAMMLANEGYDIATNVSGREETVEGTLGIEIPYTMLLDFIDKAGTFIGVRSGLCDIISGTHAKKVILYPVPSNAFRPDDYGAFFSMKSMGLGDEKLYDVVAEEEDASIFDRILTLL